MNTTQRFADYLATFDSERLPADVVGQARRVVLDTLGAIIAATPRRYSGSRIITEFVRCQGGTPESSVIGSDCKVGAVHAALANGTLGYYCDVESHHPGAIMHGAAIVVPTALAVGESRHSNGRQYLAAVVAGIDAACRASYAINQNDLYNRGFHPSSVCGAFGAAAAAGHLVGLGRERFENALGLTATEASGLLAWASDHTENSRPFNPGIAARNGTTAALLAEQGFGAPQGVFDLDTKYNVYRAWSTEPHPELVNADLHRRYFITEVAFKLYSCCAFLHPALDGLIAIAERERLGISDVESLTLRFAHTGQSIINNNPLKSHCAQYILPIGLLDRRIVIDDILQDRRADARLAALSQRVEVVGDDEMEKGYPDHYPSVIEVRTRGGATFSERVEWPRGYPQNPVSDADLRRKFFDLAVPVCGQERAERIAALVDALESLSDVSVLAELLRYEPQG